MIPRITHQIWVGSPPPEDVKLRTKRLQELNQDWVHFLWNEKMLSDVGFDCDKAAKKFPKHAGVSNAARLFILREFGGFYFDTDFLPLKPLEPLVYMGYCLAAKQRDGRVCNAFMAASPWHHWICYQCDRVPEYEGIAPFWGVELASRAPKEAVTILDSNLFYPHMWDDPEEKRVSHKDTIMMHLWDASWVPLKQ